MKHPEHCERCGQLIKRDFAKVMLELNLHTCLYRMPGIIAQKDSQGCFPFHASCAERELMKTFRHMNTRREDQLKKRASRLVNRALEKL